MTVTSLDDFRAELRQGRRPSGAVQRLAAGELVGVLGARKVRLCFSDNTVDRMGDRIEASGWQLAQFRRNPVVLWAHDSTAPPIGRCSGVWVDGDRLMGDVEFAAAEIYPFAETVYQLVKAGFVNACSVGFRPIEYAFTRDKNRPPYAIDFTKQELLELSICPIPANANALVQARSKGLSVAPLKDWEERQKRIERLRPGTGRRRTVEPDPRPLEWLIAGTAEDRRRALSRSLEESIAEASAAGCAIDRQRARQRREQADLVEREIRVLELAPAAHTVERRAIHAASRQNLRLQLAAWRGA